MKFSWNNFGFLTEHFQPLVVYFGNIIDNLGLFSSNFPESANGFFDFTDIFLILFELRLRSKTYTD